MFAHSKFLFTRLSGLYTSRNIVTYWEDGLLMYKIFRLPSFIANSNTCIPWYTCYSNGWKLEMTFADWSILPVGKADQYFRHKSTADWSSGLRSRLRNQRSQVQIPVVSKSFCEEQLHLLTSHGCLYIIMNITYMFTIYLGLSVI
jgi:hypothetical protein